MSRRFWTCAALTAPLLVLAMGDYIPGRPIDQTDVAGRHEMDRAGSGDARVSLGGMAVFVRGWASIVNRSPNMFTLIGLGVAVAYLFSVVATLLPGLFPAGFRDESGQVGVYFEVAAVIVTLVLLGQVLELRARSQTSAAIKALLGWRQLCASDSRTAPRRTCRSMGVTLAIACACGRARRFRLMAW